MNSPEFLRVRAWLRTGVVADRWLPLDGVLFYQAVRRDLGPQEVTIPGASLLEQPKGRAAPGGRLPLAIARGREWYYRCSWAQWGPHADGQDYWNKRFDVGFADLVDFRGRRGRVIVEQSSYRAYHMPISYRAALWVEWYCVGDRQAIGELLCCTTHLGKKTSQGWGRVSRWEIKPIPEDWSVWREGRLMRGIPPEDLSGSFAADLRIANYGIRPSYWDRRNQTTLVMPA